MPSVVHVVTTANFAGVERYVAAAAVETTARGWDVTVVGGHPQLMPARLGSDVRWLPGATPLTAAGSVARLGRQSICHAHMTIAEGIAVAARPLHRARVVSTRHFAAARGSSRAGRLAAPAISGLVDRQIAVSDFVATRLERPPDAVIKNAVLPSPCLWSPASRTVLVLQRLEREKDTLTALRAWKLSRLTDEDWSLRVVGDGAERAMLERWVADEGVAGVTFAGWSTDVPAEFSSAGVLLAPGPSDSFGLGVLEAMAAGVPVLACGSGGHLETVGLLPEAPMFPPADAATAADRLRLLQSDEMRSTLSAAGRRVVETSFSLEQHVDQLLDQYELVLASRRKGRSSTASSDGQLRELIVCSLEAWDDVWRRNQFFTDILLRRNPELRVLFVEPPADPLFDLASRRRPSLPRTRRISPDGRLRAFRPLKPLPRKFGALVDNALRAQVAMASRLTGFSRPTLWLNDVTYAPLIQSHGLPSVYDVTDDWLLAPSTARELERLRHLDKLALETADEVVVCSRALAESRGNGRAVSLIPNGVDVEHFRRPRKRPEDLPSSPVAVYVGSLHDARIDTELVLDLARRLPHLQLALVGPDGLDGASRKALEQLANVHLLGPRRYEDVPAYLQHADVVVVPHRVSPFTNSLDPIKAYESLAVDPVTVATPVAGFRDQPSIVVAEREEFVAAVADVLSAGTRRADTEPPPTWEARAVDFENVVVRAARSRQLADNSLQRLRFGS